MATDMSNAHSLTSPFLRALTLEQRVHWERSAINLDSALWELYHRSHGLWPQISLDPVVFVAFLAARWPVDKDPDPTFSALNTVDLFLVCGCLEGHGDALLLFTQRYLDQVPAMTARLAMSDIVRDELQDQLREKFLAPQSGRSKLAEYSGRGALQVWVRVTAVRTALKLLDRAENRNRVDCEADALSPWSIDHPELANIKDLDRSLFQGALREAIAGLNIELRNVLRLHYLDGMKQTAIARLLKLSTATVSRQLKEAREQIIQRVRHRLTAQLSLSESDMATLAELVSSQLDLSLSRILN